MCWSPNGWYFSPQTESLTSTAAITVLMAKTTGVFLQAEKNKLTSCILVVLLKILSYILICQVIVPWLTFQPPEWNWRYDCNLCPLHRNNKKHFLQGRSDTMFCSHSYIVFLSADRCVLFLSPPQGNGNIPCSEWELVIWLKRHVYIFEVCIGINWVWQQ